METFELMKIVELWCWHIGAVDQIILDGYFIRKQYSKKYGSSACTNKKKSTKCCNFLNNHSSVVKNCVLSNFHQGSNLFAEWT